MTPAPRRARGTGPGGGTWRPSSIRGTRAACSRPPPFWTSCAAPHVLRRSRRCRPVGLEPVPHRQLASGYWAFAASLLQHPQRFRDEERLSCMRTRAKSVLSGLRRSSKAADTGCNTVPMTPRPDVVQDSLLEPNQPIATPSAGAEEVGPISPELVLVDPALAERARELLPSRGDLGRSSSPQCDHPRAPAVPRAQHQARAAALAAHGGVGGAHPGGRRRLRGTARKARVVASAFKARGRSRSANDGTGRKQGADHTKRSTQCGPRKKQATRGPESLGGKRPRSHGKRRQRGSQARVEEAQPLRPRGRSANTRLRNEQRRRLPRPCNGISRCLCASVQRISLRDRQLRSARSSVDRRSHVRRDRGLYLAGRRIIAVNHAEERSGSRCDPWTCRSSRPGVPRVGSAGSSWARTDASRP